MFMSTSRTGHSRGSSAATVMRPSGGIVARRPAMATPYWSPQYVLGNSGDTSRTRRPASASRGMEGMPEN
jgi:hypothetical protein